MFGYVICNKSELTKEDQERYQSAYCGLCRELKRKYGLAARLSLNYDMAFLALFLSSLYEPDETKNELRCVIHPVHKRKAIESPLIEYAADMTILLTYYKCLDDWNDEKRKISEKCAKMLEKHLPDLSKKYPRQYLCVSRKYEELAKFETAYGDVSDAIVNCSGEMLSEIFVYKEDYWSGALRKFGYELGRFIYLMDAVMDYEKDQKEGNFNPFFRQQYDPDQADEILKIMIGNAMEQFEILPIVEDEKLLKNILYSGVWTQYNAKKAGKEKPNDGRSL